MRCPSADGGASAQLTHVLLGEWGGTVGAL